MWAGHIAGEGKRSFSAFFTQLKKLNPRALDASFQTFLRDGQDHLRLQLVEGGRWYLQPMTQISPTEWTWARTIPLLLCGYTTVPSPQSQARDWAPLHLLLTWTVRELWLPAEHTLCPNHPVAELPPQTSFAETLWNIIGPFTEFCLDRQDAEEAFALWVPHTLIIVQVTIASEPNKRCLRKQGIRHQLWFMGSWKKCSAQKNNT